MLYNQYVMEDLSRQWQHERRAEVHQQGWFAHWLPRPANRNRGQR